jgi:peptidoglycan/LPS O-acetylase OafA/YrhL
MPDASKGRLVQLDVLRGLAILLVLGRHAVVLPAKAGLLRVPAEVWQRFGWTGVDLFFVLSGFLVGGLLFKELRTASKLDVGRFIIRRGLKIWPSYFLYLIFVSVVLGWKHRGGSLLQVGHLLMPNLLHIQNYLGTERPHTWSLAVEEHFYLILPLLLLLVTPRRQEGVRAIRAIPVIAVALIICCTAARMITTRMYPQFDDLIHVYPTHLRIDSLFFGVLLAYLYHFKAQALARIAVYRLTLLLVGTALTVPVMVSVLERDRFVPTLGFALLYLGYGCILVAVVSTPVGEGWLGRFFATMPARAIAFIGYFSYPVYLWHVDIGRTPVAFLVKRGALDVLPAEARWVVAMAMYILTAVVVGALMSIVVERPTLALRDRFFPARATALGAPDERQVEAVPSEAPIAAREAGSARPAVLLES